jgi:hypothetical protein
MPGFEGPGEHQAMFRTCSESTAITGVGCAVSRREIFATDAARLRNSPR